MNANVALTMSLVAVDTTSTDQTIVVEVNRDGTAANLDIVLKARESVSISGSTCRPHARVKSRRCVKCNTIVDSTATCCWKCGSKRIR